MSRRRSLGLAGALALTALATHPLGAQSAALADAPATVLALGDRPVRSRPAPLKNEYRVRLQSTWPQLPGGSPECFNGGEETLDGTLAANADGTYGGTFERRTRLLFCGAHGPSGQSCALTLTGQGSVVMTGVVLDDDLSASGRSLRVEWTPAPSNRAEVSGVCPTAFKNALERMYLTTRHAVEFPLTTDGRRRTERLENYAWRVELE
ncbi:MAG: hypothetical protein ACREL3_03440 [Gemmatimonadales bacterium]